MENCTTCAHALFDAKWGEYICGFNDIGLRMYLTPDTCPLADAYKKGTPEISKEDHYADGY